MPDVVVVVGAEEVLIAVKRLEGGGHHLIDAEGHLHPCIVQRTIQPFDMLADLEGLAAIRAGGVVYRVPPLKSTVENRDFRLAFGHKFAVEKHHTLVHWAGPPGSDHICRLSPMQK